MLSYTAAPDIDIITSPFPIPGFGIVPINAFVLKGSEPVLVDTGAGVESEDFMNELRSVIDPAELKWIWLTHTDFDHIGSLHQLLSENADLRVITTFLGTGIMGLSAPLPMDRLHFLNPGEQLTVGDRTLTAYKPPAFDNPSTTGFFDEKSRILFSADCFGAILQDVPQFAAELTETDLREGQVFWATVDAPWLHKADGGILAKELDQIRAMEPAMLCSSHLPPATPAVAELLYANFLTVPGATPFVGPDQAALEQMLKEMTTGAG